jgi:hypothetical protein
VPFNSDDYWTRDPAINSYKQSTCVITLASWHFATAKIRVSMNERHSSFFSFWYFLFLSFPLRFNFLPSHFPLLHAFLSFLFFFPFPFLSYFLLKLSSPSFLRRLFIYCKCIPVHSISPSFFPFSTLHPLQTPFSPIPLGPSKAAIQVFIPVPFRCSFFGHGILDHFGGSETLTSGNTQGLAI